MLHYRKKLMPALEHIELKYRIQNLNKFWSFLYGPAGSRGDGLYIEFRYIGTGVAGREWVPINDLEFHTKTLVTDVSGRHIYFGVNPRTEKGGKAEHVREFNDIVWADIDKKSGAVFSDILLAKVPPPNVIVDTGHGWHLYWKMHYGIPHERAQRLMEQIAYLVGGDSVGDPARILRIPYSTNWKAPPYPTSKIIRMDNKPRHGYWDLTLDNPGIEISLPRKRTMIGRGTHTRATGTRSRSEILFSVAMRSIASGDPKAETFNAMLTDEAGTKLNEMSPKRRMEWMEITYENARTAIYGRRRR